MEKKRNLGIDFTKFVCAIMVVGIHIAPFGIQETNSVLYYANFYLQNCVFRIAVPFFFVTIGMALFKDKDKILQKRYGVVYCVHVCYSLLKFLY